MNRYSLLLLTGVALFGLLFGNWARAGVFDIESCRGGYSYLLVTEGECKTYLEQHHLLEQRKDLEALKNLEADYAIMLKERSEACPCLMRTKQSAVPGRTASYSP
jgi:hypothetical protein